MRILLVANGFEAARLDESGSWLGELATRLVSRGHRVNALCTHATEAWQAPEDPAGVPVWRPGPEGLDGALLQVLETRPDVVHLVSDGPWSERAASALADAPLLLDAHGFWPICANGDLLQRPRYLPCAQHHLHPDCGPCAGLSRVRAMDGRVTLGVRARRVLAHSRWARERLAEGLNREIDMIPFGVDPLRFSSEPRPPLAPDIAALFADRNRPRVLLLGPPGITRGSARATDLLVALNARVPGVELVIAGRDPEDPDGPQRQLAEARELGLLGQVRRIAVVNPSDLPALIASCTVACAPGTVADWGGLFVMQALAAGVPVVANPAGAIPELLTHGREGLLVPIRELAAFAHAIAALLQDPHARAAYGERARLSAIERFDAERAVFALEELYQRVRIREGSEPPAERSPSRRAAA